VNTTATALQSAVPLAQAVRIPRLEGVYFNLPLPEGWVERSFYSAGGPIFEGFQSSLTVTVETRLQLTDLLACVRLQMNQLEGQLTDFALLPGTEQPVKDGQGYRLDFTWTTQEQVPIRQRQWYLYRSPLLWIITASAHKNAFDEIEGLLSHAAQQFSTKP
jgi:hypothetical protein